MGLREVLKSAGDTVFSALDNVPEGATLTVQTSTHDPTTATNTKTSTAHAIEKMALVRFNRIEIGAPLQGERGALLENRNPIEAGDLKGIFRQNEIPGVVPQHKDFVTADGKEWVILGVAKDPAEVIWILQLRAR